MDWVRVALDDDPWELSELGLTSPSLRTISRVVERHGLVTRQRGPYVPTGVAYPTLPADFKFQGEYVSALALAPTDPSHAYAVTSRGRLFWSTDGAVTWTNAGDTDFFVFHARPTLENLRQVLFDLPVPRWALNSAIVTVEDGLIIRLGEYLERAEALEAVGLSE